LAITDNKDIIQNVYEELASANRVTFIDSTGSSLISSADAARSTNTQVISVQNIDPQGFAFRTDASTHAIYTVNYEHHEIHEGDHYYICGLASGSAGTVADFAVSTSNTTKRAHMTFNIEGTVVGSQIQIYEVSDYDLDGTVITPFNNNRNSANTSNLSISLDPTINSLGTLIYDAKSGTNRGSGVVERDREIILKQNTAYVFRISSLGANNVISYCGEWYEHTDRD